MGKEREREREWAHIPLMQLTAQFATVNIQRGYFQLKNKWMWRNRKEYTHTKRGNRKGVVRNYFKPWRCQVYSMWNPENHVMLCWSTCVWGAALLKGKNSWQMRNERLRQVWIQWRHYSSCLKLLLGISVLEQVALGSLIQGASSRDTSWKQARK